MLSAGIASAQNFHHITVEMGLSNSTTFSIVRDGKGLMWFSTKEGIDRYDGAHFKNYVLYSPAGITKYGLRQNKFYLDSDKNVWVYNFYEVFVYNRLKDDFEKKYSINANNTIRDIFVDNEQNKVFIASDKGLIAYDYKKNIACTYPKITESIISFTPYSDSLFILTHSNSIQFLNIKTQTFEEMLSPEIKKQISGLRDISGACVDPDKTIYIASLGQISAFKIEDSQLKTNPQLNRKIDRTVISKIVADTDGSVFIGTPGKGLFQIDNQLNLKTYYYINHTDNKNTNVNEISDIYIDSTHRLWIAGNEISYLKNKELNFQYYHNTHNQSSLYNNEVRSFTEDSDGNLWVGTNYGISILNADRKTWSHLNPRNAESNVLSNKIIALATGASGRIFAGSAQGEIFTAGNHHAVTFVGNNGNSVYKTGINALLADGDELWYGGSGSYLACRNLKSGAIKSFSIANVLCIIQNRKGQIITGGHNGLHILSNKNEIKNYDAVKYNIGSLFCVVEDDRQFLWLASEGQGLIKFDPRHDTFQKYTTADGLSSDLVYGIIPDRQGNLWLSTTKGISCFHIKKEIFKNYTLDDGLPMKEFVYGAYGKMTNGEILFGGNNGFILFDPKELLDFDLKTDLVMIDFKIFNKSVKPGVEKSPLQQSIDETHSIQLQYNQNSVTFEFSSVNLVNNANYYRWKLEGLDTEWSPVTKVNQANYTNLKPGKYTFAVQWSNVNTQTQISKNTRRIEIEIAPPFWKTIYAYLIYLVLITTVIYWIVKFYHTQLSERHAKERIRFFVNILHDIRTPLSLIKVPLKIAIKKNDFSGETLDALNKANNNVSHLTKLVDQLLDFDKKDLKKSELKLSLVNVEQTLDKLCENFIPLLEQKGILLTKNHQGTETVLPLDLDKFDKIIFNLLSNSIKYTGEGGQIRLDTQIIGKKFQISIADNGIGIPEEQQKLIFKKYFRAKNVVQSNETGFGIGLMITKELVHLHGGEIGFESAVNHGTTFCVRLPMDIAPPANELPDEAPDVSEELTAETVTGEKQAGNRRPKVLIAEDNDELRTMMENRLKETFKIISVPNGQEGLKMLQKTSIDAIVSDIMMPVMDGTEFCYEVKNAPKTNHIPFILLTALNSTEHKTEGYRIGADVYIDKPVDIDLLTHCIHNLLKNRKKIRDKFTKETAPVIEGLNETDKKFMEQALKIIKTKFSDSEFSVEDLEREIGMSHANLYRKFKSLFNQTPMEFIQLYRLKKSVELLQSGNYYINEVSYMVGFSDPKYFSNLFKKYYGKKASEFLKEKK
jgi:signal transduction histidine kinase/DNA-binding response OmpR family regulator/ligand-binding sensor domain-containing protein